MQKWKKDARKRKEVEKKKLDVKQQMNRWGKKILKFITLFPLDTLLDNLGCRYMTGMTLPSKWSCFTINIIILFTFVSLKVVGYIITRQFLERLPNKKKTIILHNQSHYYVFGWYRYIVMTLKLCPQLDKNHKGILTDVILILKDLWHSQIGSTQVICTEWNSKQINWIQSNDITTCLGMD